MNKSSVTTYFCVDENSRNLKFERCQKRVGNIGECGKKKN